MQEKSENFNRLRPILFELCKKNYRGGGSNCPPPPAEIWLMGTTLQCNYVNPGKYNIFNDSSVELYIHCTIVHVLIVHVLICPGSNIKSVQFTCFNYNVLKNDKEIDKYKCKIKLENYLCVKIYQDHREDNYLSSPVAQLALL